MKIFKPGEVQQGAKSFDPYITISNRHIYFSSFLVRKLGLKEWDHLYFINDKYWWGFYKTNNNDGYSLRSKGRSSLQIEHTTLIRAIKTNLRIEKSESFAIKISNKEMQGQVIYELQTSCKVKKLKDDKILQSI
jgi:hypothetical protein